MYKIKVSTILKIIKICADKFRNQSYYPEYEDYEDACKEEIAGLFGIPAMFDTVEDYVETVKVPNISKSFSSENTL